MTTRFKHRRAFVISAANVVAARAILARHGYGPDCFSISLTRTDAKDLLLESDTPISAYVAYFSGVDEVSIGIIKRKLAHLGVEEIADKTFPEVLTAKQSTRNTERHEYGVAIAVRAANRAAIITALTPRYADANTRFFKTQLSTSGAAPIQAYGDRWKVDRSFGADLKAFCGQWPKSEVWIWCKNQDSLKAATAVFGGVEYQSTDSANRAKARVRVLNGNPTPASILAELNLKIIT